MTDRTSKWSTVLLLLAAWGCGIAGILWAYLLALAAATGSVPQMSSGHFLMTLPLPICAALAAWFVLSRARRNVVPRGFLWGAVPAFVLAACGLFIGFSAYFSAA
jgi:hypothetical protein